MLKYLTIYLTLKTLTSYIIEIETTPGKKTCISEIFPENEPISITARITEKYRDRFSIYITIENSNKLLLAHKKYKPEENSCLITYNNEKAQSLSICIDNFENYIIPLELDIKFSHHLANTDQAPSFGEFEGINEKLDFVRAKMQKSFDYYGQSKVFAERIVGRSGSFEWSLGIVGFLSLGVVLGVGVLQVLVLRRDVVRKKNW